MKRFFIFWAVLFLSISTLSVFGQWPTLSINSGNPNFPFPQFLEYQMGKSLAKYNAEGVTHADMEKNMREAYEIMTHRCRMTGTTFCGVPYITFNTAAVPGNYGTFCSEGDGYVLLAAAIFADQPTFNGLWMWIHDNRLSNVKKYKKCEMLRPDYKFVPYMAGWESEEATAAGDGLCNSATDGDVDIAMALLIAYKQWGEFMYHNGTLVKDACGAPISYKAAAQSAVKALVDTFALVTPGSGVKGYMIGDIGVDGYVTRGNTWGELTTWRTANTDPKYAWLKTPPYVYSIWGGTYVDYIAPAYFNEFANWLENEDGQGTTWQINQFKRAEASSDWIMGQLYKQGGIGCAGTFSCTNDGSNPTFGFYSDGEDFRLSWRTNLNPMWHGAPQTTWNPVTHETVTSTNTFEKDIALRHALRMEAPWSSENVIECNKMGASPDAGQPKWYGVAHIPQNWTFKGVVKQDNTHINNAVGTGAPACVLSENLTLLADIYRQSEIMWDGNNTLAILTPTERYIGSTPKYFHEWFRVLGLLTCTGNLHAPRNMVAAANMKVYMSVNKTYAYQGDQLEYKVSYRNYGKLDATGVTITTPLDPDYTFVSANKGGKLVGNNIVWAIGTVPGFKSGGLEATRDSVSFIVTIKDTLNKRVCLQSTISSSNAPNWVSNEYPNNATYTMERNCVDILTLRTLLISKTSNRLKMNPNDIAQFTIKFENHASADSWLNGGRSNVALSYGNYIATGGYNFYQYVRFWHDASESYINLHNYRISYFMNDVAAIGLYNATTNPTGWKFSVDNQNDLDKYGYNPTTGPITFTHQKIPAGFDNFGYWNQRIIVQFADVLSAPTTHIFDKLDSDYLLHKGVRGPALIRLALLSTPASQLEPRLLDDWSYSTAIKSSSLDGQADQFYPISPSYADVNNLGVPITNFARHVCSPNVSNYDRVLLEEFDGYTWRRIAGRGPLPGREATMVVVTDTIPKELIWKGFVNDLTLGVKATYTAAATGANYTGIVRWTVPGMLVGEKGNLVYEVIARDINCPAADKNYINAAWIQSQTDSPDSSSISLTTTCTALPPIITPQTSLFKTANVTQAKVGDVISYTLKYINTEGTDVVASFNKSSDWKAMGSGSLPDFKTASTSISLDQNANTSKPNSNGYAFGHIKSHGKNGYIEATIQGTNSSPLYLVFRHTAGTPGQADFKGVMLKLTPNPQGDNTINFQVFNNSTSLISETMISYGGVAHPFSIKVELIDSKMYIYINDFTGNPLKVYSGLTNVDAGYVGILADNSGSQQTITGWKTYFDSAFDLNIFDPLPTTLTTPTNISNTGALTSGTIKWPTVAGPILANATYTQTFDAKVASCSDYIVNIGMATVYGLDTLKSLNAVKCVTGVTCTTPASISIAASPSATVCAGNTVTLSATASPINTTWKYAFKKATSVVQDLATTSYTASATGSYTVLVYDTKDSATCNKTSSAINVVINSLPSIVASALPTAVCSGASATVSASGGLSYVWDNIAIGTSTSKTVAPTLTTTYVVTGTDVNNCQNTATVSLKVNTLPTIAATVSPTIICNGATATISASGGNSYIWDNGGGNLANKAITPTSTTLYKVTGTDVNSCSSTTSISVTVTALPTVTVTSDVATICAGGTAKLTASGATTYAWSNLLPPNAINSVTPSTTTTYSVTGTTNGCYATSSVKVSANPNPTVTAFGPYADVCLNGGNSTLTALPTGGTFTGTGVTGTQFDPMVAKPGTIAMNYSVTVAGCTGTATTNIIVKDTSAISITAPNTTCINGGTIALSSTPAGVFSGKGITGSTFDPLVAGIATHTLTCKVTANGCTSTKTFTIQVTAKPSITFTAIPKTCVNDSPITLIGTPTGGTFIGTGVSGSTFDPKVAGDGSFVLYYKGNQSGCIDSASQIAVVNKLPAIVWGTIPTGICGNISAITLSATPTGGTFTGTGVSGTSFNPKGLTPGTIAVNYSVTANGCSSTSTTGIQVWAKPSINITTPSNKTDICSGEAIIVHGNPSGGTSPYKKHTWTDDVLPLSNVNIEGPTFQTNNAKAYKLTYIVEDNHNCADTNSTNITVHAATKPTITAAGPFCSADAATSLTANPSSGTFKGTGITASKFDPSKASIGSNTVWYISSDTWTCIDSSNIIITVNQTPTITIATIPAKCSDDASLDLSSTATAIPSAGSWTYNGTAVSGTMFNTQTALSGSNTVTYKYSAGSCSSTATTNITVNAVPTLTFTLPTQACASDLAISLVGTPSGGSFTSSIALTGNKFDPALATANQNYDIAYAYQDAKGCNDTISKAIIVYKATKPTTTGASAVAVATNASNIPALNATGTDVTWYSDKALTKKVGTGNSFTPPASTVINIGTGKGIPGEYMYYVTETTNTCVSEIDSARLTLVNCPLTAPTGTSLKACAGDIDAKRTLTVSGLGDEFRWYRSGTLKGTGSSFIVPELTKGTYTYDVAAYSIADACESGKTTISLTINDLPVITINAPTEVCESGTPVTITVNPIGGTLSGTGISGNKFTPPLATVSPVTLQYVYTDGTTSCTNTGTAMITVNALPSITTTSIPDQCSDGAISDLSAYVSPALGTFTGTSVIGNNFDPKAAGKGSYSITYAYTDAKTCKNSKTLSVIVNPATVPSYTTAGPYCANDITAKDISANFTPSGGTITGSGVSGTMFTPSVAGKGNISVSYSLTLNGCTGTISGKILVNANPTITFPAVGPLCDDIGKVNLNATPYSSSQGLYSGSLAVANSTLGGTFDAGLATIGTNNIVDYIYTDPTTKCSASASITIEVRHTDPPTANDTSKLSVNIPPLLKLSAVGTMIQWYSDAATSVLKGSGSTFDIPQTTTGVYPYWATQTVAGCKSKGKMVTGTITDCATPAPTVTSPNVKVCKGTSIPDLVATGTLVRWYSDATLKTKVFDGSTFPTGVTSGTHVYYATQELNGCIGPYSTVSLTINDLPQVSINGPTSMCDDSKDITLTLIPTSGGTLTGTGTITPDKFSPTTAGAGTQTLTLSYTDASTNCTSSATTTIIVNHTSEPTANDTSKLVINIPPPLLLSAKGTNIKWYSDLAHQTLKGSGSTFAIPEITAGNYTYYASQTINGCESKAIPVTGTISNCTTTKPTVVNTNISICSGDVVPDIEANGTQIRWFSDASLNNKIADGSPYTTGLTSGSKTFYVTQELNGCQGPAEKVMLTINALPTVSINAPTNACGDDKPITLTLIPATGATLTGTGVTSNIFNPALANSGANVLTLSYTDPTTKCSNSTTSTITVTKLSAPTASNKITSSVNPDLVLTAIAQGTGILEWYKSSSLIYTGTDYKQTETTPSIYNYTVKETENGCSSPETPVSLTIVKCNPPTPGVDAIQKKVCPNQKITFTANTLSNATGIWWKNIKTGVTSTGKVLTPSTTNAGDYTWELTQDTGGCTSAPVIVSLHVTGTREPVVKSTSLIACDGQSVTFETVGMGGIVTWYDAVGTKVSVNSSKLQTMADKAGTYGLTITHDSLNCKSKPVTVTYTLQNLPQSPTITGDDSIEVCANGSPITILANSASGTTIHWYDYTNKQFNTGMTYTPVHSNMQLGKTTIYHLIAESSSPACSSKPTDVRYTILNQIAKPTILKSKFCLGNESVEIKTSGTNLHWYTQSGNPTSLQNEVAKMTIANDYQLKAIDESNNGCFSDTSEITISILPSVVPFISGQDSLCSPTTKAIYEITPNGKSQDSILWHVSGDRISYQMSNNKWQLAVDWNEQGIDTVSAIVITSNGCKGSTSIPVRVAPKPKALFITESTGYEGKYAFVNVTIQDSIIKNDIKEPVDLKYVWNYGRDDDKDVITTSLLPSQEVLFKPGYFKVSLKAINVFGCSDIYESTIYSTISSGLSVPNSFCPDATSAINKFHAVGFNMESFKMWIYDQWGNLLWYTDALKDGSPSESWDGNTNGETLKMDCYIWKIEATFKDGSEWRGIPKPGGGYTKYGNVLLLR